MALFVVIPRFNLMDQIGEDEMVERKHQVPVEVAEQGSGIVVGGYRQHVAVPLRWSVNSSQALPGNFISARNRSLRSG